MMLILIYYVESFVRNHCVFLILEEYDTGSNCYIYWNPIKFYFNNGYFIPNQKYLSTWQFRDRQEHNVWNIAYPKNQRLTLVVKYNVHN